PSWMARFPAGGLIMKKLPTPGLSMRRLHRPSPKDLCGDPLKVAGSALQSWLLYPPSVPLPIASHSAGAGNCRRSPIASRAAACPRSSVATVSQKDPTECIETLPNPPHIACEPREIMHLSCLESMLRNGTFEVNQKSKSVATDRCSLPCRRCHQAGG